MSPALQEEPHTAAQSRSEQVGKAEPLPSPQQPTDGPENPHQGTTGTPPPPPSPSRGGGGPGDKPDPPRWKIRLIGLLVAILLGGLVGILTAHIERALQERELQA